MSSPAGKGANCRLDYRILNQIEMELRKKFATRIAQEDFPESIRFAFDSLAVKCKNLKAKARKKN